LTAGATVRVTVLTAGATVRVTVLTAGATDEEASEDAPADTAGVERGVDDPSEETGGLTVVAAASLTGVVAVLTVVVALATVCTALPRTPSAGFAAITGVAQAAVPTSPIRTTAIAPTRTPTTAQ